MHGARADEPDRGVVAGRRLILASASPRRRDLLQAAGVRFDCDPADVDESPPPGVTADVEAVVVARRKADAVAARHPGSVVLGADTIVVASDGARLGKPTDAADARRILRLLSNSTQRVITGVAIVHPAGAVTFAEETRVTMRVLTDDEIAAYVASGEPFGKAGAYALQETGDRFVERIDGSFDNVVGLPVKRVLAELSTLAAGTPS